MNYSNYFDFIAEELFSLANRIERRGKLNILDLHISAEMFFRDFFNVLFYWSLDKTENHNESGIDLIDTINKIVVSISATANKRKVQDSLNKVNSNYSDYKFKFISISKDAKNLRNKSYSTPNNLKFSSNDDIFDTDKLLKIISEMDIDRLKEVYDFFKKVFDTETLIPFERLKIYLCNKNDWEHQLGEDQSSIFHYEQFPEFTIVENQNFDEDEYNEPWVSLFPDSHFPSRYEYFAKYHDTVLTKIYLVCCDGGRFLTAEPKRWFHNSPQTYYYAYYLIKDSIEYLAEQMINEVDPHSCRALSIYEEIVKFESEEDANERIEDDFINKKHQYIYYGFDKDVQRYSRIEKGVVNPIILR